MDDVVTVLEVRRRFEIPAALCSAPGRQIAPTAQEVIAQRRLFDFVACMSRISRRISATT